MKKLIGSTEELRKECEELKRHLDKLNSPVVFCHNDMNPMNIIYSKEKGISNIQPFSKHLSAIFI